MYIAVVDSAGFFTSKRIVTQQGGDPPHHVVSPAHNDRLVSKYNENMYMYLVDGGETERDKKGQC